MNKKRILQLVIAASTIAGGLSLQGITANATEVNQNQSIAVNAKSERATRKGQVVNVSTSLRVRSEANTSSSVIGYLYNGDKFDILGTSGEWYKISYSNIVGYVHKDYVKELQVETTQKGEVVNVSSSLRIRSAASTNSSVLGTLQPGDKFDILGKSGEWYNIKFGTIVGYVHGDYVKITGTSNVTPQEPETPSEKIGQVYNVSTNLRVRTSPSTSATVLGYLINGENVKIKDQSGEWYKIDFEGKDGYVHKDYIKLVEAGNSGNSTNPPSNNNNSESVVNKIGQVYNVSTNLRVRSAADSNSTVIGYLLNGDIVDIQGQSGSWYKINFNGQTGFVHSDYIKIVEGAVNPSSTYETVYNAMKQHIGAPYVWGGAGELLTTSLLNTLKQRFPNEAASGMYTRAEGYVDQGYRAFDCSGLMQWGFKQAGINLGRTTRDQIYNGKEVSLSDIKPGDLLFYSDLNHVGMYVGNDQWIESPNKNANVRITAVPWSKIGRARRVLN